MSHDGTGLTSGGSCFGVVASWTGAGAIGECEVIHAGGTVHRVAILAIRVDLGARLALGRSAVEEGSTTTGTISRRKQGEIGSTGRAGARVRTANAMADGRRT